MAVDRKEIAHLVLGEAETVGEVGIEHRIDLRVVQPGEDALLRDTQNPGHHAEPAVLAVLERGREEVPEKLERLLSESVRRGVVDRRIVLVDQNHGLLAVVRMERGGEDAECPLEVSRGDLFKTQLTMERPNGLNTLLGGKHRLVAVIFIAHGVRDHLAGLRPVRPFRVLERDVYDRILSLLGAVRGILPDLQALEEAGVRRLRLLEERVKHLQRERLAEPARACEERDRGLLVEKPGYELGLVGRPVALPDRRPVTVPDEERRQLTRRHLSLSAQSPFVPCFPSRFHRLIPPDSPRNPTREPPMGQATRLDTPHASRHGASFTMGA